MGSRPIRLRIAPELVSRRLRARLAQESAQDSRSSPLSPYQTSIPPSEHSNQFPLSTDNDERERQNAIISEMGFDSAWSRSSTPLQHLQDHQPTPESSSPSPTSSDQSHPPHQRTSPLSILDDGPDPSFGDGSTALGLTKPAGLTTLPGKQHTPSRPIVTDKDSFRARKASAASVYTLGRDPTSPVVQTLPRARGADGRPRAATRDFPQTQTRRPSASSPKASTLPRPKLPSTLSSDRPTNSRQAKQSKPIPSTSLGLSPSPKPRLGPRSKPSTARKVSTPTHPSVLRNQRPRSLSASSIHEMGPLPPWSTEPSPLIYRVDPQADGAEPGYDDLILPTVARQLEAQQKLRTDLAERSKTSPVDVSDWDPIGTPVLLRKVTPSPLPVSLPSPLPASPSEPTPPSPSSLRSLKLPAPQPNPSASPDERPIRPAQVSFIHTFP